MSILLGIGLLATLLISGISLLILLSNKEGLFDLAGVEGPLGRLLEGQDRADRLFRDEMTRGREEAYSLARGNREELVATLELTRGAVAQQLEQLRIVLDDRHKEMRDEANANRQSHREEIAGSLAGLSDTVLKRVADLASLQKAEHIAVIGELQTLSASNEGRLDGLRVVVDTRLREIYENNTKQLEEMRATVDEKLHGTLEKRLGESFGLVVERLEQVHKGLGEMQGLAAGVGDLKRVFSNVRARGAWGEIQLQALLSDILTPDQYDENVGIKEGSAERVEFAIRFPGDQNGGIVYLPVDSKFPIEDYQRLVDAQDRADLVAIEQAGRKLEISIRSSARAIGEKYLDPPKTTEFGMMFLPSEALYAEVARRSGLLEVVRRECHIVVVGPSTLAATLNAFRMGFRTLAIQERSSEVWKLLGAVKAQFGQFGTLLDKVKKRLDQAVDTVDGAARKSRTIQRKLRDVEILPEREALVLLENGDDDADLRDSEVAGRAADLGPTDDVA